MSYVNGVVYFKFSLFISVEVSSFFGKIAFKIGAKVKKKQIYLILKTTSILILYLLLRIILIFN